MVVQFQKARVRIDTAIRVIRETDFFLVERKILYEHNGFMVAQSKQHEQVRGRALGSQGCVGDAECEGAHG